MSVVLIEWVPDGVRLTGLVRVCRSIHFLVGLIVWVRVGGFDDGVVAGRVDYSGA